MKHKDYYSVLGISKDASKEDIQRAYRKGARKYHPDINKNIGAEAHFKEINAANDVLKDPDKRKRYDLYGEHWDQPHEQGNSGENRWHGSNDTFYDSFRTGTDDYGVGSENVDEFINNLFGSGPAHHSGPQVYESEITMTLSDVFDRETRSLSFGTPEINPINGQREIKEKKLKVKIPKGVSDGSVIRIRNFDKNTKTEGNGADLLLKIRIAADARFEINGHNLHTIVSISPWEAALGAKVEVETIDGTVNLSIPPGTRAGKRFRLKGKGLPGRHGGDGDIIIETVIQIPDSLSDDEKALFQELAQKSEYNPRFSSNGGQRAGSSVNAQAS